MPTDAPACPPDHYQAVLVEGPDAASFLQGQLTQEVLTLAAGSVRRAALLTPQGRVLATAWVTAREGGLALLVPAPLATAVHERLRRYLLRARARLALAPPASATLALLAATLAADGGAASDWMLALIRAGAAEVGATTSEEWIPQMLNLDLTGAIHFQKGCYTGQEIVARTQHLGRIKRRMFRLRAPAGPPQPKAALLAGGLKAGEVVLSAATPAGCELLAVVNLDARGAPLTLEGGAACEWADLPYPVP